MCRESSEHLMTTGDIGAPTSHLKEKFPQVCLLQWDIHIDPAPSHGAGLMCGPRHQSIEHNHHLVVTRLQAQRQVSRCLPAEEVLLAVLRRSGAAAGALVVYATGQ